MEPKIKETYRNKKPIRVLSFNIHKGKGWLKFKSTLVLIRDEIRLLDPDIVLLQEARNEQFEYIAENVWPHFSYGKNSVYPKGHHGNAILSKFPIILSENLDISIGRYERRGLLHSIAEIPNSQNLHLLCVHLGLFKKDRFMQLKKIVEYITTKIPKEEPLIIGGDFNDWYYHATEHMVNQLGLQEAFLNSQGTYAKTFPAWAPMLSLDRIYCRGFDTGTAQRYIHSQWRRLSDHVAIDVILKFIK